MPYNPEPKQKHFEAQRQAAYKAKADHLKRLSKTAVKNDVALKVIPPDQLAQHLLLETKNSTENKDKKKKQKKNVFEQTRKRRAQALAKQKAAHAKLLERYEKQNSAEKFATDEGIKTETVAVENFMRDAHLSNLPNNKKRLHPIPTLSSPPITKTQAILLILMTLFGLAGGIPTVKRDSEESEKIDGQNPLTGDSSAVLAKPIIHQKTPDKYHVVLPNTDTLPIANPVLNEKNAGDKTPLQVALGSRVPQNQEKEQFSKIKVELATRILEERFNQALTTAKIVEDLDQKLDASQELQEKFNIAWEIEEKLQSTETLLNGLARELDAMRSAASLETKNQIDFIKHEIEKKIKNYKEKIKSKIATLQELKIVNNEKAKENQEITNSKSVHHKPQPKIADNTDDRPVKKFERDYKNARGELIVPMTEKLADLFQPLEPGSSSFRMIETPLAKHLSECSGLTERPAANGAQRKIDIMGFRLRKALDPKTIPIAIDSAFKAFANRKINSVEEILDAYEIDDRKKIAEEVEKLVAGETPDRLEEFRKIKTYHCVSLRHELQKARHRLDYIDTTSAVIIPNFEIDSQSVTIIFTKKDIYLNALQRDLVFAFIENKPEVLKQKAALGIEFPPIQTQKSKTPMSILNILTEKDYSEVIEIALNYGVNPNGIDENDCPLMGFISAGNIKLMELLIKHGADIHKQVPRGGESKQQLKRRLNVFDAALSSGKLEPLKYLIENHRSSLTSEETNIVTSLLMTRGKITAEQLGYLIDNGLDLNQEYSGHNLLHVAASSAYNEVVEAILLKAEHPERLINKLSSRGSTPLQLAIGSYGVADEDIMSVSRDQELKQRIKLVKFLMRAGADLFITDSQGRVAKDYALEMNLPEIAELLDKVMQKDPHRYAQYLAQKQEKNKLNGWLGVSLFVLIMLAVTITTYFRKKLERSIEEDERALQQARPVRDVNPEQERNAREDSLRRNAELQRQQTEVKRKQKEAESKREAEALASDLQSRFNRITQEKQQVSELIAGFKGRSPYFMFREDKKKEVFPQGLMNLISEKLKSQGDQYKLANKIKDKKNEIDTDIKEFDKSLLSYDEKLKIYDEKNAVCQRGLSLANIEALKKAQLDLESIERDLKDLERNINRRKEAVQGLVTDFEAACHQAPARPAAASEERKFRFDPQAEKEVHTPGEPSSSKSKKEEVVAPPPEPIAGLSAEPKLRRRKPAAAKASALAKQSVSIRTLAVNFPPPAIAKQELPVLPVRPVMPAQNAQLQIPDLVDINSHEPVTSDETAYTTFTP